MSDIRRTILKAISKKKRIWFNGRYHDPNSDELPTWIRPQTDAEKEASKKGMAQWLADAAADPRSRKAIGGISLIGAGTYGATQAMTKRRKAND